MAFMTVLKVIFTLLLCVPLVYLMIYFLMKLIDEVVRQNKGCLLYTSDAADD